ncbi:hypothetical protein BH20CHL8_BH20CHL8_04830 [soil metagenome]
MSHGAAGVRLRAVRAAIFGVCVCLSSWIGLLVGAGNVGLQRAVTSGPGVLIVEHPLAVPLLLGTAFFVAFGFARVWRESSRRAVALAAAVVVGDLVGSFILAPLAVGELEVAHGPRVFLVISFFGAQIVAAYAGARFGARSSVSPER